VALPALARSRNRPVAGIAAMVPLDRNHPKTTRLAKSSGAESSIRVTGRESDRFHRVDPERSMIVRNWSNAASIAAWR
jgi:hypothetical protein